MSGPTVRLVAAVARNRIIGRDNALPWHLPEDLKRFRRITLDQSVIMGRRTYESIGRALPRRRNVVVSRQAGLELEGCEVVPSLEAAFACVEEDRDAMVIGGAQIYAQAMPFATVMHLTLIDADVEGDALFPHYRESDWREIFREAHLPDSGPAFSFVDLERVMSN